MVTFTTPIVFQLLASSGVLERKTSYFLAPSTPDQPMVTTLLSVPRIAPALSKGSKRLLSVKSFTADSDSGLPATGAVALIL